MHSTDATRQGRSIENGSAPGSYDGSLMPSESAFLPGVESALGYPGRISSSGISVRARGGSHGLLLCLEEYEALLACHSLAPWWYGERRGSLVLGYSKEDKEEYGKRFCVRKEKRRRCNGRRKSVELGFHVCLSSPRLAGLQYIASS